MAIQEINIGTVPNDGTGDSPRDAGTKINANFTEVSESIVDLGPDVPQTLENKTLIAPVILPDFYALATDASIREKISEAGEAGGGVVHIPAGRINIFSELTPENGVIVRGASGTTYDANEYPDVGTTLYGNGTYRCFTYNPTDNPSLTPGIHYDGLLKNAGFENLNIESFSDGFKIGATNKGGMQSLHFRDVRVANCTGWGALLENCSLGGIDRLYCYNNTVGQVRLRFSAPGFDFGNFYINGLTGAGPTGTGINRSRGIIIEGFNGGAFNSLDIRALEAFGSSATTLYTATATLTAASRSIGVTDLSKFMLEMPVVFGTTVGNVVAGVLYFIDYVSASTGAGTIRVSTRMGGKAADYITPSTSGTPDIKTRGFAPLEIRNGGAIIANIPDMEHPGTAGAIIQDIHNADLTFGLFGIPDDAATVDLCARLQSSSGDSVKVWIGKPAARRDIDANSAQMQINGGSATAYSTTATGVGVGFNTVTKATSLSLSGLGPDQYWDGTRSELVSVRNPASATGYVGAGGVLFLGTAANAAVMCYTGTPGSNIYLPTISDTPFASNAVHSGREGFFVNGTQYVLTLNAPGGQLIDNKYSTRIIPPNSSFRVAPAKTNTGTFFWGVVGPAGWFPTVTYSEISGTAAYNLTIIYVVTDSNTNTPGATIAGGGSNVVFARSNGTVFTVFM